MMLKRERPTLLGVKGTLFAAELHILQARMHGALLSKARRGELVVCLPVGYRRRPDGVAVLDPDEAVRLAVATVFERFAVLRNARAVQRHFLRNGLALPRLIQHGPQAGQTVWMRPAYQMIQKMLTTRPMPACSSTAGSNARWSRVSRRRRSSGGLAGGMGHRRPGCLSRLPEL